MGAKPVNFGVEKFPLTLVEYYAERKTTSKGVQNKQIVKFKGTTEDGIEIVMSLKGPEAAVLARFAHTIWGLSLDPATDVVVELKSASGQLLQEYDDIDTTPNAPTGADDESFPTDEPDELLEELEKQLNM